MSCCARDIMTPELITIRSDMDVRELARLFLEKQISGAPVVDAFGDLVGVISQTDLVYHSLTAGQQPTQDTRFYEMPRIDGQPIPSGFHIEEIHAVPVSELMTPIVHAVTEDAELNSIMDLMICEHIHRVVVTRGNKAIGIVSALDVMNSLRKETVEAS
jgi:predicted transcriptional regulator